MNLKSFTKVLLIGVLLYIASSLLTFSWKADIPDADIYAPPINVLCAHPFGFPLKFTSWDNQCVAGNYILFAQGFNVVFWLIVSLLGYWLISNFQGIKSKFSRYPYLTWPVIIGGSLIFVVIMFAASHLLFVFTLVQISTQHSARFDAETRKNFNRELAENYIEYKNESLGFSVAQPKDVTVQEINILQNQRYKDKGVVGIVNFYKNENLYFTVEAVNTNAPPDSDFTQYDDLAHILGGSSLRASMDTYMHLARSKPSCVPMETVRTFCKSYFVSKISGSRYTYVLSGFAEDLDSFGPDVKPTAYISDHSYDKMLFSLKPLD